jgi:hypothetical protein
LIEVKGIEHGDLMEYAKIVRHDIWDNIKKYHAVLIRGLPMDHAEEFSKVFYDGLGFTPMGYKGGAGVRDPVTEKIYTASREPPEFNIEPHNEMANMDTWPPKVSTPIQI